ncbi:MAG: valine--tRNA ligase [Magnetococcales bacterium]|nr:valine--tRNA ligase [Magnetococcales bacterium]
MGIHDTPPDEGTLAKSYDPAGVERRWYQHWEDKGWFTPTLEEGRAGYCIMIPPPNVTGSLHMGHAFQDTLMDALTRMNRMNRKDALWLVGTDHAGIATQMVVERQLAAEGKTRHDLGRQTFIDRVWNWKKSSGGTIVRQLRRMGTSCDWSRERFTMDPALSHGVREVFVRLYNEGLIYRGKRLVNWDPMLHTAVSDLEVVSEEEEGFLWHLRYPLTDGSGHLVVATTRPETMLGDAAVAVHPEDDRYRHLVGKEVDLPLTGRRIPVIADDHVDPAFGTGCVKITPAHDFNDYDMGKRHGLPMINILDVDASLNDQTPPDYRGLDRYVARKQIVADLTALGLLDKIQPHKLMVPRGDRSKAVVEPYLTDQWFVRAAPLAEEAIRAVEDGRIRFVPENWSKTYFEWMRNIQDWCISRQIWWGHRIPAWYGPDGHIFVCNCEEEVYELAAEHYGRPTKLVQDADVLDTWFSSALWPFSTLGWPKKTPELARFYPTDVLVTGFDIIFFWVARMIMMGLKFTGEVPFRTVYIHGLVRDGEGQKMSKSKGNVLDPLDLIDGIDLESLVKKRTSDMMQPHLAAKIEASTRKEFPHGIPAFGTDALRFTFASLATQGRDIKFDLGRIEGYRNFCNKLWNASRFVLMNVPEPTTPTPTGDLSPADHWIRGKLAQTMGEVNDAFAQYRFSDAANVLYQFVWGNYCDWYLELVKPALYAEGDSPAKRAARRTLVEVLETALRLLHPLMPFLTEELWQKAAPLAGRGGESIMLAPWPTVEEAGAFAGEDPRVAGLEWIMGLISAVRTVRSEMNLPPSLKLELVISGEAGRLALVEAFETEVKALARIARWRRLEGPAPAGCAAGLTEGARFFIPLEGIIDLAAEEARLSRELARVVGEVEKVERKLGQPDFLAKAKPEAIDKEREKQREFGEKRHALDEALARIRALRG